MKVTVKLFASLSEYLPPEARRNQVDMDLPDDITPAALMDRLKLPHDLCHLLFIDGVFVPPSERGTRAIGEGEEVAMFPPVAGG